MPVVSSPPSTLPEPSSPPPRPTRKEVNPNAPYVIFACAGVSRSSSRCAQATTADFHWLLRQTAVTVGVLIGLRRVSQLRTKTMELSASAAAAEAAEAGVAGGKPASGQIISGARPGRTASILSKGSLAGVKTTASQQPSRGNPFQAAAAAVKGPEATLAGAPSSKPLSAATASLLRKPAPGPATAAPPRQLFPPSQARPTSSPTASTPVSTGSVAPDSAAAPKATIRSLIKEGRKKDADEHEELPPMTTAVMLRAAGAFAMATGLAVCLVGGPFVAACWWLGVEEVSDVWSAVLWPALSLD